MRVAIFTESIPPLTDGVARTFTRLAESLCREGVDFRFFSPVEPAPRALKARPWLGRVRLLPSFRLPLYRYYRIGLPFRPGLRRELEAFGPDLVHVCAPTPLEIWAQNYALRRGLPLVSSYHTHFVSYFRYYHAASLEWAGWALLRWFHNRCLATYAPSPSARALLQARGIRGARLWRRGIDTRRFSPRHADKALRRRLSPDGRPLVLFVGRLVKEKNLLELAEALARLSRRGLKFRPVFLGDGPLKAHLAGALPGALLPGFIEGEELSRFFASCDLFAFPSTTETFGNVVLEAMASGLPVVGAAEGGVADIVEPGRTGLLCRPRDPADLAEKIASVLKSPLLRRRLRAAGLKEAARHHWDAVNRVLISDYRAACAA